MFLYCFQFLNRYHHSMIEKKRFELKSEYAPAGDQPKAIQEIADAFDK